MRDYKNQRKFWLGKLKDMGVKAPAAMYPVEDNLDYQEDQIERMKAHVCELAEFAAAQAQYAE